MRCYYKLPIAGLPALQDPMIAICQGLGSYTVRILTNLPALLDLMIAKSILTAMYKDLIAHYIEK